MSKIGKALAMAVGIAAAVLLFAGTVRAEAHTDHCECGGSPTALSSTAHTCDDPVPEWEAVTTPADLLTKAAQTDTELWLYIDQEATEFTLTNRVMIGAGSTVHLCLNGHKVVAKSAARAFYIDDTSESTLTICDCARTTESGIYAGSTSNGSTYGGNFYIGHFGTLRMYNVTVSGGHAGRHGGNMYLLNGNKDADQRLPFQFFDCTIKDGYSGGSGDTTKNGGNITATKVKLEFYNTTVTGGTTTYTGSTTANGGNIYVSGEYLKVVGGSIDTASAKTSGGNIYATQAAVTLSDNAVVSGGSSTSHGGNIFVAKNTTLTLEDDAKIYGGSATGSNVFGGNVYIQNSDSTTVSGVFYMNGGEVYGGNCTGNGANVRVEGRFYMSGGTIRDPLSKDSVFVNIQQDLTRSLHSYMEMSGGTIKDPAAGKANIWVNGGSSSSSSYLSGVLRMTGGTLQVSEGKTGRNIGSQGAIYISGNSHLIHNGTAGMSGSNIYIYSSASSKPDRTDTTDTTKYHPYLEITGGTIEGGSAANASSDSDPILATTTQIYGGSIFLSTRVKSPNTYTIKNATITGGSVDASGHSDYTFACGGNIYVGRATALIENCTVTQGSVTITGTTTRAFGGNIFVDTDGELTIKDSAVNSGALLKTGTASVNGNGTNISTKGILNIQGTTVVNNPRQSATGNNTATNADSARIYLTGGTVDYIQTVSGKSELHVSGGSIPGGVGVYTGKLYVTAGRVGGFTLSNSNSIAEISGGYVSGTIKLNNGSATFTGGFYQNDPEAATGFAAHGTLGDGDAVIPGTYSNPDTTDTTVYGYEVAPGYVIIATSIARPGDVANVAAISGGGRVRASSNPVLTAGESAAYEFVKWELPDGTESTDNPLAVTASGDYVAVYRYKSSGEYTLNVTDLAGAAFTAYTVDSGAATSPYPSGTEITLTYSGEESDFNGWYNESDKLISRETVYTFNIIRNTTLKAAVKAETASVIFYTISNQVYRSVAKSSLTSDADLPAVPTVRGKTDGAWNKDFAAIQASAADIIEVKPTYTDGSDVYEVTVQYVDETGTAVAEEETKDPKPVTEMTSVTAPDINGYVFQYYLLNGEIVSYGATTTFRFNTNTTIQAVYGPAAVTEKVTVTFVTKTVDNQMLYFEALRSVPENYTLKEQGILFANEAKMAGVDAETALTLNSANCYDYKSTGKGLNDVTGLTLKNVPDTVYARAYVVYEVSGEIGVAFSEIASLTPAQN